MKKIFSALACLLLFLVAFVPIGKLIAILFGYSFNLGSYWTFAILIAVITAALVALSILKKEEVEVDNIAIQIVFAALTPFTLINTLFYIDACKAPWLIMSVFLLVGCGYLTIRHGKPQVVKTGAIVLAASLILPVCLFAVVLLAVANSKTDTVVQTLPSPEGTHYAQVIKNDQGNGRGNTIVKVCQDKGFDVGVFNVKKQAINLYLGKLEELDTLQLQWDGENCLKINDGDYKFE